MNTEEASLVEVSVEKAFKALVNTEWVAFVVTAVLRSVRTPARPEVSVLVASDETVRELNRDYRRVDEPTDVLAFPLTETKGRRKFVLPPDGVSRLGEVVVSYPRAEAQAAAAGHAVARELALLLVHGTLHLVGCDHGTPKEQAAMESKQQEILSALVNF